MFRGIAAKLVGGRRSQFAKGTRGNFMKEPNKAAEPGETFMARGGAAGRGVEYDESPYAETDEEGADDDLDYAMGGGVGGGEGMDDADRDGRGRSDNNLEGYMAGGGEAGNERTSWNEQDDEDMDGEEQRYAEGGEAKKKMWHSHVEPGLGVASAGTEEQWSRGIDPMVQGGGRDARILARKTMDGLQNQAHPSGENRERIDTAQDAVGSKEGWDKSDSVGTEYSKHDDDNYAEGGEAGEEGEEGDSGDSGLMQCAQDLISAVKSGDANGVMQAMKDFQELSDNDEG